jgi:bacterioferritin
MRIMAEGSCSTRYSRYGRDPDRAQQKMGHGPVTESYGKRADQVPALLNEVFATEIVCWMRYSAISVSGIDRAQASSQFTMRVAERISQLGGDPTLIRPRWPGARTTCVRRRRVAAGD